MSIAKKLMTTGKSDPTYVEDVFSTYLYEGNGGTQTINNGIDLEGEGGMVWLKRRDTYEDHYLHDTERGTGVRLLSNSTSAEQTVGLSSFNADGFSVAASQYITSGAEYASWTFRKAPNFFDVVTYTGDNVSSREIPHNLGVAPGMVIVKRTDSNGDWYVWHKNGGDYASLTNARGYLNNTDQFRTGSPFDFVDLRMTDSTFGLGASNGSNASGGEYVAYLFAHDDSDESMIKCGSYTGTGNADGPEIDLGFEPQWVMLKSTTGSHGWIIHDTMRGWTADGKPIARLRADQANAEYNDANYTEIAVTPTGFRMTDTHASTNGSGEEYIYMAIRRPNKPAEELDPDELFAINTRGADSPGVKPAYVSNFPVDAALRAISDSSIGDNRMSARLTGTGQLATNGTAAETSDTENTWDYMDGWSKPSPVTSTWYSWMFRRAPGFFDVVAYEGDGTSASFKHNLGVTPELKIIKIRNDAFDWVVGGDVVTGGTRDYQMYLNTTAPKANTSYWSTTDSELEFSVVVNNFMTNAAGQSYIAYLFASVPGISKVGTYAGQGAGYAIDVDCGFSNGARFVLVKRVNDTGGWYVWDAERGIVASPGQEPYLLLNTTASQVYADFISTYSGGFRITSIAGLNAELNANGSTYLFYAIA